MVVDTRSATDCQREEKIMAANRRQSQSKSQSDRASKLAQLFNQKSTGATSSFVTDVTGVLVELSSPSQTGRAETYEYEGQTRAATWRATIRTMSGTMVYWNWPAYMDGEFSMPGVNIIDPGWSINDLLGGQVARFYRDQKSRRSRVVPVNAQSKAEEYDDDFVPWDEAE